MREPLWIPIVGLVAIALLIVFAISDCRAQQRCEALGGRVEKYDCSTFYTTTSCGSGCWTTTPTTTCNWRCVGAPAERVR